MNIQTEAYKVKIMSTVVLYESSDTGKPEWAIIVIGHVLWEPLKPSNLKFK